MERKLRLSPEEERWLWECWGPSHREYNPVFGRLDAMVDFISPMWKDSLRFVEPNLSGIGGLHLVPTKTNLLGVKGGSEAGNVGVPPAVVHAIVDALSPFGVTDVPLPATPERVWRLLTRRPA